MLAVMEITPTFWMAMESGSAVNCAITGALASEGPVGGGAVDVTGGAGGGCTGGFFLHPAANITTHRPMQIVALLLILNSVFLNSVLQFKKLLLGPDGHLVPALASEWFHAGPVGEHSKDLHLAAKAVG